jgi:tubulin beta
VCDENGIGGGDEYCGGNDAQLKHISVFHHEATGAKYVPRAVLMDRRCNLKSPIGELLRPGSLLY